MIFLFSVSEGKGRPGGGFTVLFKMIPDKKILCPINLDYTGGGAYLNAT